MASGYEKSPDYGGGEPNLTLIAVLSVVAVLVFAAAFFWEPLWAILQTWSK